MPVYSVGGVRDTVPGEDREDLIAQAGKQEIPLTLTNKAENLAEDDSNDMKPLFVRYSDSMWQLSVAIPQIKPIH